MLSPVGTPSPIQGAAGQYVRASSQFQSTTPLTGRSITFNPGFTASQSAPTNASAWVVTYPASGTVDMTFTGPAVWKNYRATLEVINATNFRISLYFLIGQGRDYVGGATAPDNSNPFTQLPTAVTFAVSDGGTPAYVTTPIQATGFCQGGGITFDIDYTSGVRVTINSSQSVVSTAYVGFYRTDAISGTQAFPDDADFNYGTLSLSPAATDFPEGCFASRRPFLPSSSSNGDRASVSLSCVSPGAQYRLYVVYNDGKRWRSCQSEVIELVSNLPVIAGDISYSISDGTNTYAVGCLTEVPPCKDLAVSVTMDPTTYNAALANNNISGVHDDYLTGIEVTVQTSFSGAASGVRRSVAVNGSTGTFNYAAEPGTVYLVFIFTYTFPDRVDTILAPVQISTVDYTTLIGPSELCAEDTSPITVDLPQSISGALITQYDAPGQYVAGTGITAAGNVLTIDPTSIPVGVRRCYEICAEDPKGGTSQDCVCDCECINVYFEASICGGQLTARMGINASLGDSLLTSADIKQISFSASGGISQTSTNATVVSGTASIPSYPIIYVSGQVELTNGCVYSTPMQTFDLRNNCQDDVPSLRLCNANCNCDDVPPPPSACENFIEITDVCQNGMLSFQHNEQFNSPVASDVIECSLDGQTWGPCSVQYSETEVHSRRTVSFGDDCPDLTVTHVGRCTADRNCVNSAQLLVDKTDTLLTLTVQGTYGSPVGAETIYYSIDGGGTYQVYTAPVTLSGSEVITAYSLTTFSDGCPDVLTPVVDAGGAALSGEPFVTYCDGDGNVTGFALAVVDPSGNQTIYYDANMVQRDTVPAGSPCEPYVDCATCP